MTKDEVYQIALIAARDLEHENGIWIRTIEKKSLEAELKELTRSWFWRWFYKGTIKVIQQKIDLNTAIIDHLYSEKRNKLGLDLSNV